MGKSTPAPVDYEGAALAEGEKARENIEAQTWANRPNQVNPWGSVTWSNEPRWDPTTQQNINHWTQTQTLSPALEEALRYQMGLQSGRSMLGYGMMGNVAADLGTQLDWSRFGEMYMPAQENRLTTMDLPSRWGHLQGDIPYYETTGQLTNLDYSNAPVIYDPRSQYGDLPGVSDFTERYSNLPGLRPYDYSGAPGVDTPSYANAPNVTDPYFGLQQAENAVYNRTMSRLQPQLDSERQQLEVKLRNQGLVPGDEAWDSAMQSFAFKYNDAMQNAANEAIMAGGREAQRMFGMESAYRDQSTGEVDRMTGLQQGIRGQYTDEINNLFDMSARARGQYSGEIGDLYGMETGLRGMFGSEIDRLFGMESGMRGQYTGEVTDAGNFMNQALMNEYQQRLGMGQASFADTLAAAQFQNQARAGGLDERLRVAQWNQQQQNTMADYYNRLRQAMITEEIARRGQALNEVNALLNNQQVGLPQFNQFNTAGLAQTPQLLQAASLQGQANAAQAGAENQFMNSMLGGATSLASTAMMFSDRRLKSNIKLIGKRGGVNWYSYELFGQPQIGVMADEVPWAAFEHPSGYMMVDYTKV